MSKVKPYTTKLCKENTYWMARIAKAVYMKVSEKEPAPDESSILKILQAEDSKFRSVKGYSQNTAQGALIEHQDYLCMAFRGTDEIKDWLDNINAFSEPALFGEFHRGFWNSVEDVWGVLYSRYSELVTERIRPLFFTGHSLGGAMATVAAARFIHRDRPFTAVYTFGQPRAMTRNTSRIFNLEAKSRFFRFQNNNDIVTRVPARLMGYSHVGTYIYIAENQRLHDDPGFWFRFVDSMEGALGDATEKGIDGVKDHGMENYLSAIERWDCDF